MRIAVFALIGIAVGLSLVLVFLLTGGGREFFAHTSTLTTFMGDGTGLGTDSDVRLSGITIGRVKKVDMSGLLDPQRAVRVDMRVDTRYLRNIPSDSQTSLAADTLIGDQFVSIDEGKSALPVAEDGVLRSQPVADAKDRADLILSLQSELQQVDQILQQISSGDTPIGHFLLGQQEYDRTLAQITSFDKSIHAFVGPNSPTGQILFSDKLYRSIREPVLRLDATLDSIQKGEGPAGKLFTSDEQYNTLLQQLKDLDQSITAMQPSLTDDALYRRVSALLRDTDAMILSVTRGEGAGARLLQNAQLYESLNGSLRGMQELLKDLREHPQKYLRYKVFNKN